MRYENAGLAIQVFHSVKSNLTGENVVGGVVAYRNGGHNGVIAFGEGGRFHIGKAVRLASKTP